MPRTHDFPISQAAADQLGIAGYNVEGSLSLAIIEVRNEIQQSFSNANALVVRQNHKPVHPIILSSHVDIHNRNERDGLVLVHGAVASGVAG